MYLALFLGMSLDLIIFGFLLIVWNPVKGISMGICFPIYIGMIMGLLMIPVVLIPEEYRANSIEEIIGKVKPFNVDLKVRFMLMLGLVGGIPLFILFSNGLWLLSLCLGFLLTTICAYIFQWESQRTFKIIEVRTEADLRIIFQIMKNFSREKEFKMTWQIDVDPEKEMTTYLDEKYNIYSQQGNLIMDFSHEFGNQMIFELYDNTKLKEFEELDELVTIAYEDRARESSIKELDNIVDKTIKSVNFEVVDWGPKKKDTEFVVEVETVDLEKEEKGTLDWDEVEAGDKEIDSKEILDESDEKFIKDDDELINDDE